MDSEGVVVATYQGPRTVEGFRNTGAAASRFIELREAATDGTPEQKAEFLLAGLDVAYFDREAGAEQLAALRSHMSEEQIAKAESKLFELELDGIMESVNSRERMLEIGKQFTEFAAEGKVPSADHMMAPYFWIFQFEYATDSGDVAAAEKVVSEVKSRLKGPQFDRLVEQLEAKVAEMKAEESDDDGDDEDGDDDGD